MSDGERIARAIHRLGVVVAVSSLSIAVLLMVLIRLLQSRLP